jgi:hypothetical protein
VNLELYWVHLKGGFEVPWFRSNVSGLQGFEQSPDEECLCFDSFSGWNVFSRYRSRKIANGL